MYNTHKDLLDAYRVAPDILDALLKGCTQEEAVAAKGGDEGWSVVEVVCHLRDAEERALERMLVMRDDPQPRIAGYDQEAWARERNYAAADLWETLSAFTRFREAHVRELEALTPEQWERVGQHEEYGEINILNHTMHMASHDTQHLAQIARQLKG